MDALTPKGLAQSLVGKHEQFIQKYSEELGAGERVSVLMEKRDQLRHWIVDGKSKDKNVKALAVVEEEIKKIEDSGLLKPASYYKTLKEKISEHEKSRDYWVSRGKEVGST